MSDLPEIAKTLAKEALKLDSLCRSESAEDKDKVAQLEKVAKLARVVGCCDCGYLPEDDDAGFGGGC